MTVLLNSQAVFLLRLKIKGTLNYTFPGFRQTPNVGKIRDTMDYMEKSNMTPMSEQHKHHNVIKPHMSANRQPVNMNISSVLKKPICCNCKKSQCLKLYCECFANKVFCQGCNCVNCANIEENRMERDKAMKATLERNPIAFDPKIAKEEDEEITDPLLRHTRGCHCKKSGCQKKYCECYQSGAKCTALCKCELCKNMEGGCDACPIITSPMQINNPEIQSNTPIEPIKNQEPEQNILIEAKDENKKIEINEPAKTPIKSESNCENNMKDVTPIKDENTPPESNENSENQITSKEEKTPQLSGKRRKAEKSAEKTGEKIIGTRRVMDRVRQMSRKGLEMAQEASGKKERVKNTLVTRSGKKINTGN